MTFSLALIAFSAPSGQAQILDPAALSKDAPIEITADSLEFDRTLNVANFLGSVEVLQGSLFLQSDTLRVLYDSGGNSADSTALTGDIDRIEANGNVSIVSEETRATGDWAIYDVTGNIVTLGGTVKLQSDGNVLVGERLIIDMASGNTRLEAGVAAGGGRVRGIFQPSTATEPAPG